MSTLSLIAQAADKPIHLELGGMAIMGLSIAIVVLLAGFCIYRIFRVPPDGTPD